jgi:hypothetical protein
MLKHFYVTLLDLPEALPFAFTPSGKIEDLAKEDKTEAKAERKLLAFVTFLCKKFGDKFAYIGEDVIGEKFYRRFLFEKNGFLEIMTGVPAVISAHFTSKARAEKFARALEKTIEKQVSNAKAKKILLQSVEVSEDEESRLSFEKWEKMREIRASAE